MARQRRTSEPLYRQILATGGAALARFKGRVIEVFDVVKPADLIHALHLAKNGSKLSPLFANTCELDLTLELNAEAAWPQGKWVRQDPTFPEVIFDSEEITPTPGIEIKVWFPLTTEITGRFKESVSRFAQDQTNIAVLAWLPEHILYGKPVILDTSARTRNLRQTNTTGYKFQDTPELLVRAKEVMEQLGIEAEFAFTAEYQRKLKELRSKFTYRSDSNFSKIDRIGHEGLEAFKTRVLNTTLAGRTINEWRTVFRSAARSDNARAAINGLIGLRNHGWS